MNTAGSNPTVETVRKQATYLGRSHGEELELAISPYKDRPALCMVFANAYTEAHTPGTQAA